MRRSSRDRGTRREDADGRGERAAATAAAAVAWWILGCGCSAVGGPDPPGGASATPIVSLGGGGERLGPDRSFAPSSAPSAPRSEPLPATIRWIRSGPRARRLAREQRRLLLAYVRAGWSVPCRRMEREVFARPEVSRALRQVVPWWVDATVVDRSVEAQLAALGSVRPPALLLLAPSGAELARLEGEQDAGEVIALVARAAQR